MSEKSKNRVSRSLPQSANESLRFNGCHMVAGPAQPKTRHSSAWRQPCGSRRRPVRCGTPAPGCCRQGQGIKSLQRKEAGDHNVLRLMHPSSTAGATALQGKSKTNAKVNALGMARQWVSTPAVCQGTPYANSLKEHLRQKKWGNLFAKYEQEELITEQQQIGHDIKQPGYNVTGIRVWASKKHIFWAGKPTSEENWDHLTLIKLYHHTYHCFLRLPAPVSLFLVMQKPVFFRIRHINFSDSANVHAAAKHPTMKLEILNSWEMQWHEYLVACSWKILYRALKSNLLFYNLLFYEFCDKLSEILWMQHPWI